MVDGFLSLFLDTPYGIVDLETVAQCYALVSSEVVGGHRPELLRTRFRDNINAKVRGISFPGFTQRYAFGALEKRWHLLKGTFEWLCAG